MTCRTKGVFESFRQTRKKLTTGSKSPIVSLRVVSTSVQGYGPGEEDESQARLAQLQADRALCVPKEALAVSGRRAVVREDVAHASAARRAISNARV